MNQNQMQPPSLAKEYRAKTTADIIQAMAKQIDEYETVFQAFYMTNQHDRTTMTNICMLNYIDHFAEMYGSMADRLRSIKD